MATLEVSRPSMSRQLAANVVGRAWVLLANLLFAPVYLHLMGMASFGVIGLFLAVSGLITFLDLGLSPTMARELHVQGRAPADRASLLYTYEVAYAAIICALIALAIFVPADAFRLVLSSADLGRAEVAESIRLVFAAAAAQMLLNFYVAGLLGIEQQILANIVLVAAGVVRGALVIVPLWVRPTPGVFLAWQLIWVLAFALTARMLLYRAIGAGRPSGSRSFQCRTIVQNSAFTGGMLFVSVTAAVNTQVDKVFVGRLVGLEALAQYSLVTTFAQLLVFVVSPITIMLLPRLVRSASAGDHASVRRMFIASHRVVAGLVCAGLASMLFFGPYLISVWTVGKLSADSISEFAPLLIGGYGLLALGAVPHCVAIANKNLKGSLAIGLSIFVTVPGYSLMVQKFGVAGAATTWLLLQSVVVPLYLVWVVKRFIGIPQLGHFLVSTVVLPFCAALAVCAVGYQFLEEGVDIWRNLSVISAAVLVSAGASMRLTVRPRDRAYLLASLAK